MAKPLARGLGLIGSSKLEVERWTLRNKRLNFEHRTLNVERRISSKQTMLKA